jgi:ATP-dependent DNA ligase
VDQSGLLSSARREISSSGGKDDEGPKNSVGAQTAFIEPMQCRPLTSLPAGTRWIFEIKFDGYRCIAVKRGQEVTLISRYKKVLNKRFPGVVEALASLGGENTN